MLWIGCCVDCVVLESGSRVFISGGNCCSDDDGDGDVRSSGFSTSAFPSIAKDTERGDKERQSPALPLAG